MERNTVGKFAEKVSNYIMKELGGYRLATEDHVNQDKYFIETKAGKLAMGVDKNIDSGILTVWGRFDDFGKAKERGIVKSNPKYNFHTDKDIGSVKALEEFKNHLESVLI